MNASKDRDLLQAQSSPVDARETSSIVIKKIGVLVFSLAVSSALLASHPGTIETPLADGGLVISKSFKKNWVIYSSVGGGTDVKGNETKRKWWCLWLCKVRVDKNAERIAIMNVYYAEVSPGVFASSPEGPVICNNASSCEQKHWAFGIGVKIEFPGAARAPRHCPDCFRSTA